MVWPGTSQDHHELSVLSTADAVPVTPLPWCQPAPLFVSSPAISLPPQAPDGISPRIRPDH